MGSLEDSSHADCLLRNLHRLFKTSYLCDVTLKAMDGCEMAAHWLILVAQSEYFHSLHENRNSDLVALDADSETLGNILDYLYTGRVKVTDSNRKQLLDAGQLLKLHSFVTFLTEPQASCVDDFRATEFSQGPSDPTSVTVNVHLSQLPEFGEDFDIQKVKQESDEEDQLNPNLYVAFSSQHPGLSQVTQHQCVSPHNLDLQAPVQIQHIVPNIAGQEEHSVLHHSQRQLEENNQSSSVISSVSPSVDTRLKTRKRRRSVVTRYPQKVPLRQNSMSAVKRSSQTRSRAQRSLSKLEEKLKVLKSVGMKSRPAGIKGCSINSSFKSGPITQRSELSVERSKGSGLTENKIVSDYEESRKDSGEEPLSCGVEKMVPSLPDMSNSDSEREGSLITNRKKTGKGDKSQKKLRRAGNFLTRWDKSSICSLCGFEGQIYQVVTHKKSAHPEDAHVCPLCFNKSANYSAMVQHLKRQHLWRESGKYQCLKCQKDCHNRVGLLSHDQIMHGVKHVEVLVCDSEGCNFYCASQSPATMEEHMKGHGDTFNYDCNQCDKKYKTKKGLKNHMYQHINSQRYQCEICGYFTATPSDLKLHTTTSHSEGPLYHCHMCGNSYRSHYSMEDHLWKVHGQKDEKRKCLHCDECDFITLWQGTLTAHKKIHATEKNFACEICGKIFRTPNNLSSHRNSTHKECDLNCNFPFCQHTTKTLDHMRKHLMIAHYYKGVKPYSCVYCPYKSMTGGNVRKHVMVQHPTETVKYVPDRDILAEMKAKWLSLDKSQWTDILKNK